MKKLAIFTPGFLPVPATDGGAVETLITYLIKENENNPIYKIDLYTITDDAKKTYDFKYTKLILIPNKQKNFFIHIYYALKNRITWWLGRSQKIYSYARYRMIKDFKEDYYDEILIENNMDIYEGLLPKIKKEKVDFHLHNDFDCNDRAKTKEKMQLVANTADKILVPSTFLKNKILSEVSVHSSKQIKVLYNAVNLKNLHHLSKKEINTLKLKYNINEADTVFTFIGRFNSDKGIDKLLESINLIKKNNIKFLLVGDNKEKKYGNYKYLNKIKSLSKNIASKIIFTGYIPNKQLYKIYSITDCVIIPSQVEEIFGVVGLETMTMGIPIISTEIGALPEIISRNCGIFVKKDKNYSKNLANAIIYVATNINLRKKLGTNGVKRSQLFPSSSEQYFKNFNECIN